MEKQLAELIEKVDSLSENYRSSLEVLSRPSQEQDINQEELKTLRRIIGNFHPTNNSPTYRDIVDENKKLKEEVENLKKENKDILQRNHQIENELLAIRRSPHIINDVESIQQKNTPKPSLHLFTHKNKLEEKNSSEKTEEDKLELFRQRLFDPRFSDSQIEFLANVLHTGPLCADELLDLADYRLSPSKMNSLYSIFLSKHGITVNIATQPKNEDAESSTGQNDAPSATTIPLEINFDNNNSNIKKFAMQITKKQRR